MASKLGQWLVTRTAAQLAEVLARRPEVVAPPAPRNLAELAERLQSRASVTAAFQRLPLPAVQLIEAIQAFGGPLVGVAQLADAVGRTSDDADLAATLDVLALRALVWPDAGPAGELRMAGPLWSMFHHPLHLGPPAERLFSARTVGDVRRFATALGVPGEKSKQRVIDDLASWARDGERVRAAIAEAPADVRALLHRVAWDGPAVSAPGMLFGYGHSADPTLNWALERGLLVADGWQAAVMPGEVGMALRGPDWRVPFTPRPPRTDLVTADPATVAREAAAAAGSAVAAVSALLEACASTPVALLRAGGVGTRELRRLAKAVGCDERTVRLWLELAYVAGLLGASAETVLPTQAYDDWSAADPADRLAPLFRAWWRLPNAPLASTGVNGHAPPAALTFHVSGEHLAELRQELLHAAADLPPGHGVADGDQLAEAVHWRVPMLVTAFTDTPDLVTGLWREAVALGAVAHGALTGLGHAALTDDLATLAGAARSLLPAAVPSALFQADLTAVVPGTPTPALARLLDSAADRESGAATGAAIWRFHAGSVRRALDSGRSAPELLAALREAAAGTALPQPLEYLVGDVARRHGLVRVRGVGCVLRSQEPALLAEIVAARALAPLRLALLAPTVLVSVAAPAATLAALRAAGYAPVGESSDGVVTVERVARRRAPRPARLPGVRRPTIEPARSTTDLPALATALLSAPAVSSLAAAGDAASSLAAGAADLALAAGGAAASLAAGAADGLGPLVGGDVAARVAAAAPQLNRAEQRLLADAVAHGAPVEIHYTNAQGNPSTRVIEPLSLRGHILEAWCHLRDDERMFALDRIEAVAPAAVPSTEGSPSTKGGGRSTIGSSSTKGGG